MELDGLFKAVSVLGLPTVLCLILSWLLYKVGTRLVNAHAEYLQDNTTEMKRQTAESKQQTVVLKQLRDDLPNLCRAKCPMDCTNYQPAPNSARASKPDHVAQAFSPIIEGKSP